MNIFTMLSDAALAVAVVLAMVTGAVLFVLVIVIEAVDRVKKRRRI